MVAAVATVYGLDTGDPEVRLMMATVLAGDVATESFKKAMKEAGATSARAFFRTARGRVIERVVNKVIRDTLRKLGVQRIGTGLILRGVPIIGGFISASVDGGACYVIARAMNFIAFRNHHKQL